MRMESGALIRMNVKLGRQLDICEKALRFYADRKHFDTVPSDTPDERRTRLLDNGGVAEDALQELNAHLEPVTLDGVYSYVGHSIYRGEQFFADADTEDDAKTLCAALNRPTRAERLRAAGFKRRPTLWERIRDWRREEAELSAPEARAETTAPAGSDLTPAVQTDAANGTSETLSRSSR